MKKLQFDEFISRLLAMGFAEDDMTPAASPGVRERLEAWPFVRSFNSPPSLRPAFRWLNTGGCSLRDFSVTVDDEMPDGSSREWGERDDGHGGSISFGAMEPTDELLAALALGAEGFTKWFNSRCAFSFETKGGDGESVGQGVVTVDGKAHASTGPVN